MVGVLELKNCKKYDLSIYPNNFPSDSESTSNWNDGISTSFTYSIHNNNSSRKTPATSIKIIKDIQSRNVIIDLEAIATAYTCSDILIEISTYRSIFLEKDNDIDSHGLLVYNKTHSLQEIEILSIDNLQPCTSYRLKMSIIEDEDKHVEIYNQNFKTDLGMFDGRNDTLLKLEKSEVILLIDDSSQEKDEEMKDKENQIVELTWADRCVDSYKIKLCRIPLECLHDRFTSLSIDALENKVTRFEVDNSCK